MKIYAVNDRLIDYFMQAFVAQDDKHVMAAISTVINTEPYKDAIAQAPHHFEIWRLGEINEDGHIAAHKELIASCESLIRSDQRRSLESREIVGQVQRTPKAPNGAPGASERLIEDGASAEVSPGKGPGRTAPGVPPGA
ncbi:MAG: nonstructural protein [Microvirus sp.]|nr:MAG: nonstructural protein [Microvirus sp.]